MKRSTESPTQPTTKHTPARKLAVSEQFSLGQIVATPAALEALQRAQQSPLDFLARHVRGEWGEVDEEDRRENELALQQGFRLLSVYTTTVGEKLWILTEADRSVTTLLLPEDY